MDVFFKSEDLARDCSDRKRRQRRWGVEGSKKVDLRLQQLAGVDTLEDMRSMPGRCHELTGKRKGQLALDLHQGFRLVFAPTEEPTPSKDDGGLDWGRVEQVTVLDIEDYH